jgi:hypothetical protein
VVITHSQGNVIAWRALASRRIPGVSHLIMLAGFPENPAAYPPKGTDGTGRIGGDALRVLAGLGRGMGFGTFDPDAPLAREILARPGGTRAVLAQRLPDEVEALLVSSSFDVTLFPHGGAVAGAEDGGTVDATHVGLVSADRTAEIVRGFLAGHVGGGPTLLATALDWIAPAFGSPPYDA